VKAAWEKYHLLFDGPGIDPTGKLAVGLGVSVTNGCRYFIRYYHDALKHAGWDDGRVLEIFGVVDFYNSFNTLATGMQIESDIRPPTGGA
jgi:alkylhydroperoxidase/carboxymuconolactone decarboxylase family protein YurZ